MAAGVATIGLAVLLGTTPARGDTIDKLTYLTFSGPVEVPGVTLPAGTYRFHLTNPATERNVIQVMSDNGNIVYSQFHTIPDVRQTVTSESTVTFRETSADAPPEIRSLFYGGEHRGYEFVYPHLTPMAMEITPASVPVVPAPKVAEAAPAPVAVAPAPAPAAPVAAPAPQARPATAQATLPKTASSLPAVALNGLGMLMLGFGTSVLRRRLS
jgi:hypothetical protein